jgi:hypothetical protein
MRVTSAILLAMALGLSACGGETTHERTVVVNPPASTPPGTVVVPPSDRTTKVCPAGYTTC